MADAENDTLRHTPPIDDDARTQRLVWRIERIAWLAFGVVIVCALLGFFGRGPLSATTAQDPSGRLSVDYEWIDRLSARSSMTVRASGLPPHGEAELRFSPSFFDEIGIDAIEPPPLRSRSDPSGSTRVYQVGPTGELDMRIEYRTDGVGVSTRTVSVLGGPELTFRQIVLP